MKGGNLSGQVSSWSVVNARVPQSSILDPLLFLISINDFPNGLSSNVERFPDDTSLFSVVHDMHNFANNWSKHLKNYKWMGFFQWKMSLFLSHISKLKNPRKMWTSPLIFNNTKIVRNNLKEIGEKCATLH